MKTNHLEKLFAEETIRQQKNYYRLAYSYTKNPEDALDIVQESIYKALSSLHTLKDPHSMKTWFYRILVNTSLDFLRKQKNVEVMDEEFLESHLPEKEPAYPDLDLQEALAQVPPMYRNIIVLRFFEDLTIDEVATILDVNPNTIKTRLYTGLKKLRLKMQA
ncbi:RNA polymerase sigma factor [Desulfosporosinus youngiae]|uniref:RNA polymerase sigma factor, sigma-70 family n=1 Tax=Desulfosporosinus youngiae DSM 17734 TaxID=768710 RepID=H5XT11_9FIRM|nr:sigma-70 family RNA polymerase sigma factor [Desulfosporosinus youngiae]EHQ87974.1 RNA polymerase sigma factor, sigma-70 family [Desulfosporosinus youngiae DSM 17734]